jgi:chromosome segregation ATPase
MLALDVLLLLLIVVCIVYCWILNQRIRDLHNSRVEFARMIKEFDAAVVKAEKCISELATMSSATTMEIRAATDNAQELVHELQTLNEFGNTLGLKLERSISDGRKLLEELETRTPAEKTKRKKNTKETKSQAKLPIEELYDESNENPRFDTGDDELLPEHTSMLKSMLSRLTTHKHQGKMDQSSYYNSLRKVSAGK